MQLRDRNRKSSNELVPDHFQGNCDVRDVPRANYCVVELSFLGIGQTFISSSQLRTLERTVGRDVESLLDHLAFISG